MDDFNVSALHESKNEWGSRLVTILTPLIIEGYKSILDEAIKICKDNNEEENTQQMLAGMINKKLKKIYIIMQNVCDMRKEELNLQNIAEQETKNKIEDIINDYKNTTSFLENKNYIDKANNKLKKLKYDLNNKNSSRRKILENETFSALRKLKNKLKPKKIKNLKELNNIRYDFNKYSTGLKINKKNIVKYWDKLLDVIFRTFKKQNPKCNNYLKRTKSNISIYNEMVSYLQKANKRREMPFA